MTTPPLVNPPKHRAARPELSADVVQAVLAYRDALRLSISAGLAYANSPNVAEAQRREKIRDETSARCLHMRRLLDEVLRGDP